MFMWILFFSTFVSWFPDGSTVRNWSFYIPIETLGWPSGIYFCRPTDRRGHLSWYWTPVCKILAVCRQEYYSWRFSGISWRFLAVRNLLFSGSVYLYIYIPTYKDRTVSAVFWLLIRLITMTCGPKRSSSYLP